MVTLEQLQAAYAEAVAKNWTNKQLADHLNMKPNSLTQRLTGIRTSLRLKGATADDVRTALPTLRREPSTKVSARDEFLGKMLTAARARTALQEKQETAPENSETQETATA